MLFYYSILRLYFMIDFELIIVSILQNCQTYWTRLLSLAKCTSITSSSCVLNHHDPIQIPRSRLLPYQRRGPSTLFCVVHLDYTLILCTPSSWSNFNEGFKIKTCKSYTMDLIRRISTKGGDWNKEMIKWLPLLS